MLVLRGDRLPHAHDGKHVDEFDVTAGERLNFSTTWAPSHLPIRQQLDSDAIVETTREEWQEWADRFEYRGPYREILVRSLLVLRLLTAETGGIVAAPTTSLPEEVGGTRNWDYRFCWLRDASLTLEALMGSGFVDETLLWRRWLIRAVAATPGHADHVRRRRLAGPAGTGDRAPAGVCELAAGPHRQRRRVAAPDRRPRRGDDGALRRPRPRPRSGGPGGSSGRSSRSSAAAGTSRTTGSGRSAARWSLHPLQRHGLGSLRPGHPRRREARPAGAGRQVA